MLLVLVSSFTFSQTASLSDTKDWIINKLQDCKMTSENYYIYYYFKDTGEGTYLYWKKVPEGSNTYSYWKVFVVNFIEIETEGNQLNIIYKDHETGNRSRSTLCVYSNCTNNFNERLTKAFNNAKAILSKSETF